MTHPLLPLRIRSLEIFWQCNALQHYLPDAPGGRSIEGCDQDVGQLLGLMDPIPQRSQKSTDPFLQPYLVWGGLVIAGSKGQIARGDLDALRQVVGRAALAEAIRAPKRLSYFKEQLQQALSQRKHQLTALDVHRIFTCYRATIQGSEKIQKAQVQSLYEMAPLFGVARDYVASIVSGVELR